MRKPKRIAVLFALSLGSIAGHSAIAEIVEVTHHGPVSLTDFECPDLQASSFVNRICYDETRSYLVVLLNNRYYHYCEVDEATYTAWINAPSLGRYYNRQVRGGPFDCRDIGLPD